MRHLLMGLAVLLMGAGLCGQGKTLLRAAERVSFEGLEEAQHIYGEEAEEAVQLRSKTVLVFYWDVNCPQCTSKRGPFKDLIALQRKEGGMDFTVIASHVGTDEDAAIAFCRERKVNFPVFQKFVIPSAPPSSTPRAVALYCGRLLKQGSLDEVTKAVGTQLSMPAGSFSSCAKKALREAEREYKQKAAERKRRAKK